MERQGWVDGFMLRTCVGVAEKERLGGWVAGVAEAIHHKATARDQLVGGRRGRRHGGSGWRRLQRRGARASRPPRWCLQALESAMLHR